MTSKRERRETGDRERAPSERGGRSDAPRHGERANAVADLQRTLGNQAVQTLAERGEIQAKLEVSNPDDAAEREADRVAEQVVRTPDRRVERTSADRGASPTDRERGASGADRHTSTVFPEVTAAGDTDPAPSIEREPASDDATTVDGDHEQTLRSITGGGRPLSKETRSYFEPRFGRDFGDVRVHTDQRADRAARSIDAEAFTHGKDVVFRSGNYRPDTGRGKQLLAHELTHVVQQSGKNTAATPSRISRKPASRTGGEGKDAPGQSGSVTGMPFLLGGLGSQIGSKEPGGGETGRRYDVNLTVEYPFYFEEKLNAARWPQVYGALRSLRGSIHGTYVSSKGTHESLKQQAENQPLVSEVSNFFGDVEMPGTHIWNGVPVALDMADSALESFKNQPDRRPGAKDAAVHNLNLALEDLVSAHKKVKKYQKGTIEGAEDAKTGLEVTAAAGSVAAGGVGGAAVTGTAATVFASAGAGAAYASTREFAQQSSRMGYGLQEEYDVTEIVEDGVESFVAGLVGGVVSGRLGPAFKRISSRHLRRIGYVDRINKRLRKEGLERINQSAFLSWLEREGVTFVGNYGNEVLKATVGDAVDRLLDSNRSLTPETVLEDAAKNFWDKEVITKAVVSHGPASTSGANSSSG